MSHTPVSIIIPLWNGRDTLDSCLGAVAAVNYPDVQIVIVDNASTDGSAAVAAEKGLGDQTIHSSRNLGFAGGCNLGIQHARGEILVLLNQDAVVERDWLRPLVEALRPREAGVVGSMCLYPDGRTIQSAGGRLVWPSGLAFSLGQHELDEPGREWDAELDFVSGCGMAFRRDLLEEIAPLDETFWPGYYEDVDFCVRAGRAGHAIRLVPEARLRHLESGAFRRWRSIWRFHHRSRLHCVLKTLTGREIVESFLPTERLVLPALAATVDGHELSRAYVETVRRTLPGLVRSAHLAPAESDRISESLLELARVAADHPDRPVPDEPASLRATRWHLHSALRQIRSSRDESGRAGEDSAESLGHEWLQLALESRESELASVKEVLAARSRDLEAADLHLRSLEQDASALRSTLVSRDAEIATALGELEARDGLLVERGEQIASLTETLDARNAEASAAGARIESLSEVLAARDEQIGAVGEELERHRGALEAERRSILDLQARIGLLESGPLGRLQAWRARRKLDS